MQESLLPSDNDGELQHSVSSSSEGEIRCEIGWRRYATGRRSTIQASLSHGHACFADLRRAGAYSTRTHGLRSQPSFHRQQLVPSPQLQPPHAEGLELKPSGPNMLLGLQHLENRGKYVPAHPVHPGSVPAVRRGTSPSQQQLAGSS
jgi:hypothetical protein